MIHSIYTASIQNITTHLIEIESHMSNGIPQINFVGLPDQTIREAKERVLVAFKNNNLKLPNKKFILNLLPSDLKKQGSHMDLAIALSLMFSSGILLNRHNYKIGALGAMNLTGAISTTEHVFSMIETLQQANCDLLFLPSGCKEALRFFNTEGFVLVESLKDVVQILESSNPRKIIEEKQEKVLLDTPMGYESPIAYCINSDMDYSEIIGQEIAKRAIMLSVAGKHNILLLGPPGTGKTMLVNRVKTLLQPLEENKVYEKMRMLSLSGLLKEPQEMIALEPFRAPHTGISLSAMLGGMQAHMLGEAALANEGVLFLDELAEYKRDVLEGLRGPLESGEVQVSKTHYKAIIPARFVLMATSNPCPCGYLGFSDRCNCNGHAISRYVSKFSGPILDRFDIKIEVAFNSEINSAASDIMQKGMSSEEMYKEIKRVRQVQKIRYGTNTVFNGIANPQEVERLFKFSEDANDWIEDKLNKSGRETSLRHHQKVIKLAQTIADFDQSDKIYRRHLIESFYYNRRKITNEPI